MPIPLDKLKKLKGRSLKEIQTRGGQAVAAYTEKMGIGGGLLTDQDLIAELDEELILSTEKISPGFLFERFYQNSDKTFFLSFANLDETVRSFRQSFGLEAERHFIERADRILNGEFDLLGYSGLAFGEPVDWHFEAVSELHSPVKHWKQFDEADSRETGDKKVIWELNRHTHFFTLGVAYVLTGNEAYAKCFAKHLAGWMDQNPPGTGVNWVSSLEIALRVISWNWAFHLFRRSEYMTPELFFEALKFVHAHGRHIEKYLSTYYSPNTHLTGEALGLYYLGTQFDFFANAANWRSKGKDILLDEIEKQIRSDGIYFEQSTWYQRYTTDIYLQFLLLQEINGEELSKDERAKVVNAMRSLLDSQMYFTRPDGSTPLIGDEDGGMLLPLTTDRHDDFRGSLAVGAVIFERGCYKWVAAEPKEAVLWLLGSEGMTVLDSIHASVPEHESRAFEESGFFVMRDGWTEGDNHLVFDAGEVGSLNGGHGHADTLSFDLTAGGRPILVDPGTYTYHRSKELRDYFRSSGAHNTLTIDDKSSSECGGVFSWHNRADAEVHRWISDERFDCVEASHNGFRRLESSPAEHFRSILTLRNDYWVVRDFVKTVGQHDYQLNFHFSPETSPEIEDASDGMWCVTESPSSGVGLRLFTFGDNGVWQRKDSWVSRTYGQRTNAPLMRYVSKGVGPQEFLTFMLPVEAGFSQPEVVETDVVGGRAFVINYRNYQDLLVFADGGQIVRTELFNTDFRFLWCRLSEGEVLPEEFVLIEGRHFSLHGREVINHPETLEHATARRFGDRLNVRSSDSVFRVSLPQRTSRTFILKSTPEV